MDISSLIIPLYLLVYLLWIFSLFALIIEQSYFDHLTGY